MIILPLPPSVNGLYNGGSGQQRFKSKAYKHWLGVCEAVVKECFTTQSTIREFRTVAENAPVELTYTYYFPDKRSRDCENYVKAVSDFLVNKAVIKDDDCFHVPKLTIIFGGIDKGNPRVEIQIQKAE